MKVVLCVPTITKPYKPFIEALEASVPALEAAGIEHMSVSTVGNPYISAARADMTRKALDAKADVIVYLDHDLSWPPEDLVRLIQTPGDVVAGTYRYKQDEVQYMGAGFSDLAEMVAGDRKPIRAERVPAGFLKVTKEAVGHFMKSYPELMYGPAYSPGIDLFNHGAKNGVWWGEDYSFCNNWRACGGEVLLIPDLNIAHHTTEKAYPGNFFDFMREGT